MLHEILPHRFDNHYQSNRLPQGDDFLLCFKNNSLLLKNTVEGFELVRYNDLQSKSAVIHPIYLFSLDGVACFLVLESPEIDEHLFTYKEMYFFRTMQPQHHAWICCVAFHLKTWYAQNQFCGTCGSKLIHKADERAMQCLQCSTVVYPKISPAIIVAIISGDKIVLARNAGFTANWYSLIAGYVDVGETLEQTVIREVKEEVGLDVFNVRYFTSQPWPFSASMMIGFVAEASENQEITIDGSEITEAAWFHRATLPNHPPALSIAGMMIEKFKNNEL